MSNRRRQGKSNPPGDGGANRPDAAAVIVSAEAYVAAQDADGAHASDDDEEADQASGPPEPGAAPEAPLEDPFETIAETIKAEGDAKPEYVTFEGCRCPEAHARLDDIMRIRSTAKPIRAFFGAVKRSWRRWPQLMLSIAVGAGAGLLLGDPVTGVLAAGGAAATATALDTGKIRRKRGEQPYPELPEFQNAWAFMSFLLVRYVNGYNFRIAAVNTIRADQASPRLVRMADFMAVELKKVAPRLVHAREILRRFQPPPKTDVFHEVDGHHDRLWAYDPLGLKESSADLGWLETLQDELYVGKFEEQLILDVNYIYFGHVEVNDMDPWLRLKRKHPDLWKEFIEDPAEEDRKRAEAEDDLPDQE